MTSNPLIHSLTARLETHLVGICHQREKSLDFFRGYAAALAVCIKEIKAVQEESLPKTSEGTTEQVSPVETE